MSNERGKKPVVHTKKHIARLERERRQSRLILYIFIGILAAVVALIIYGFVDLNYLQERRPVAKVGENEILANQFESRVRVQRQNYLIQYSQMMLYQQFGLDVSSQLQQIEAILNDAEGLGESVLNQMIDDEIVRQESAKRGITVSEEEVDKFIQESYQFFPNGTPTPTAVPTQVTYPTIPAQAFTIVTITPTPPPSPVPTTTGTPGSTPTTSATLSPGEGTAAPTATATQAATATPTTTAEPTATAGPTPTPLPTATPYTLEGFQGEYSDTLLEFDKFDINEADYRGLFQIQLLRDKLFEEVTQDVAPAEDQVWVRHILVADEETAKSVIERLDKGEDFAVLAQELSQDPGSAANGGDLGWFGKGVMVAPFEEAAFSLEPGEISDPVQSDFGYHIIQVIAHQERPLGAEEYAQATNQAFSDFLAAAREELGVEIYDLWKERVPREPNFITMATEQAKAENTALAETVNAPAETPTPADK